MQKVLYNTVIVNHRCNLDCTYCETRNNPFLTNLDKIEDKKSEFLKTINKYNSLFSAEILTLIGGGEIFLEENVTDWIWPVIDQYDHIEIITNGTKIPFEEIDKINQAASFHLSISLDGHLYEMTKARFRTEEQFKKVLSNILECLKRGIYVNVNVVITKDNASKITEFLDFLYEYRSGLVVYFLPVMDQLHKDEVKMDYSAVFINGLSSIIENHSKYKEYIAPVEYFKLLRDIMKNSGNRIKCFSPFIRTATLLDGRQVACCTNYVQELKNIHLLSTTEGHFEQPIFKLLNRNKPVLKPCKQCFPDYDLFNLFLYGFIDIEDLKFNKPFTRPKIKERLNELKVMYKGNINTVNENSLYQSIK